MTISSRTSIHPISITPNIRVQILFSLRVHSLIRVIHSLIKYALSSSSFLPTLKLPCWAGVNSVVSYAFQKRLICGDSASHGANLPGFSGFSEGCLLLANQTGSCRYMLGTHMFSRLSPALSFGRWPQLMIKLLLLSLSFSFDGRKEEEKAGTSEESGL